MTHADVPLTVEEVAQHFYRAPNGVRK